MTIDLQTIQDDVIVGLITAAALSILALTQRAVRTALFYTRHEIDLDYDSARNTCDWDIQWENFRITLRASDVSNNKVHDFQIRVNERENEVIRELYPSDKFLKGPSTKLQFKLLSIVRTKPAATGRRYRLFFVFRRRRW